MKAVFLSVLFAGIASGPIVQEFRQAQGSDVTSAAPATAVSAPRKCLREIFHKVHEERQRKIEERRALKRKGLLSFLKVCIQECKERKAAR